MSGQGSVASGTSQILTLTEGDVLAFAVLVALGETEIDNVDVILGALSASNEEVVRLDVSMNDTFFMNFLDARDHLD